MTEKKADCLEVSGEQIFQGCISALFPLYSETAEQMARLYCSANNYSKFKRKLRYLNFFFFFNLNCIVFAQETDNLALLYYLLFRDVSVLCFH